MAHKKPPQKSYLFIALGALLILALPFYLYFFKAPSILTFDKDFQLKSDVLSIDNFYDEENKRFIGEEITRSQLSYEFAGYTEGGDILVDNSFNVETLDGIEIVTINKTYAVDPLTRSHVKAPGIADRDGYLFGPIQPDKSPFTYWHINYDTPAEMEFVSEDLIFDHNTYKYKSTFTADQTHVLTHLEGVPEERGVVLDVELFLWIDPLTGLLLDYQDITNAYYYDIETGERLNPWNKFTNTIKDSSVHDNVHNAEILKKNYTFYTIYLPLISMIVGAMLLFLGFNKAFIYILYRGLSFSKEKQFIQLYAIIVAILSIWAITFIYESMSFQERKDTFVIGISTWIGSLQEVVDGFKDGLEAIGYDESKVTFIIKNANADKDEQRKIIQDFVKQDVDLIFSLTTTGTQIARTVTEQIPILFSVVTFPEEADLIASMENSQNNLVGLRYYSSAAEHYYLFEKIFSNTETLGFAFRKREANSIIQFNEFKDYFESKGIKVIAIEAGTVEELSTVGERLIPNVDTVYFGCDTLITNGGDKVLLEITKKYQIPTFGCNINSVKNGVLSAVAYDFYEIGLQNAEQASYLLEGALPKWMSSSYPHREINAVNKKAIEQLGIFLPASFYDSVDLIIE